MLVIPQQRPLSILHDFLVQSGYTGTNLSHELGLSHGLYADLSNLEPLLERTSDDALLPVLARVFFVGWPTAQDLCRKYIPYNILDVCVGANLLVQEGDTLAPQAILVPFEDTRLIACDAPRLRSNNPDAVLGPSGTTRTLAQAALRSQTTSLLDLGTGPGVLAIIAAGFSAHVTATDLNERCIEFARFNAALNGVENVEFLAGDAFAPVETRRFSRILANPPFFLAPVKTFAFSDSPLYLDGFTRKLALEASDHLEDNGVFQMICEWVQVEGEPWQQRLRSWTAESGCDVLVLLGPQLSAVDYAEKRSEESPKLHLRSRNGAMRERISYFRQNGVERIFSGIVTMRKRKGSNWFATLSGDVSPLTAVAIQSRTESLTLLHECPEPEWLTQRFRLASDTTITRKSILTDAGWTTACLELSKSDGIADALKLDMPVLQAIELFDGSRTLTEIINDVAQRQGISPGEAKARCLRLTRRLLQSSFVQAVNLQTSE
jgi:methylase of polypeptide subunit release factors